MTDTTYWTMIDSPLGPLLLTADENGISRVVMDADIDEQILRRPAGSLRSTSPGSAPSSTFHSMRKALLFSMTCGRRYRPFRTERSAATATLPRRSADQEHHVLSVWLTVAIRSR